MEREILFRGKSIESGKWLYGNLIVLWDSIYEDGEVIEYQVYFIQTCDEGTFYTNEYEVDPNTVGQFTGLTDKSGKKIFEGDIVSAFNNINKVTDPYLTTDIEPTYSAKYVEYVMGVPMLSSIKYPNGGCGVLGRYGGAMPKDISIIGNIHDNPELLTDK